MSSFIADTELFNSSLKLHYEKILPKDEALSVLSQSIEYSLFSGGKRYRPLLSLATAELLKLSKEFVVPLAIAIESIHTYSLIHDDLPCMDDDDERRGKATNHIKYGEDIALLAGDALISEALAVLVSNYSHLENFKILFEEFTDSIGAKGMIAGQVLDLKLIDPTQTDMDKIHLLKTGQLIKLSIMGVGLLAGLPQEQLQQIKALSLNLGKAFQLKDDLQDHDQSAVCNEANMVNVLGFEKVDEKLKKISAEINLSLQQLDGPTDALQKLINYNLKREN